MTNVVILICFYGEDNEITPEMYNEVVSWFNDPQDARGSLSEYVDFLSEGVFSLNSIMAGVNNSTDFMYRDIYPRSHFQPI
jgi:hypothetical protein